MNVKPGLNGKWQTQGRSAIRDFEAIVKMALDYQAQWSLEQDVRLILKPLARWCLAKEPANQDVFKDFGLGFTRR